MKRAMTHSKSKKLALHRETLCTLANRSLQRVHGGGVEPSPFRVEPVPEPGDISGCCTSEPFLNTIDLGGGISIPG